MANVKEKIHEFVEHSLDAAMKDLHKDTKIQYFTTDCQVDPEPPRTKEIIIKIGLRDFNG